MSVYGNNLVQYRNNMILNEAYVGKTKYLEEIEGLFADLKANPPSYNANIDRDPRIYKINRIVEKQFGMDIFALRVLKSASYNAYTYSLGYKFEFAKKYRDLSILVSANAQRGYYFKSGNDIAVVVNFYYGLLFDPNLSAGEVTAVLLHEIGHTFSNCLYNELYLANREIGMAYRQALISAIIYNSILSIFLIGIPDLIDNIKEYRKISNKATRKDLKKNKKKKGGKIRGWISGVIGKFKDYQDFIAELTMRVQDWTKAKKEIDIPEIDSKAAKEEYEKSSKSNSRIDEVFADKFTAVYGYGPELASALMIMDDALSKANKQIQTSGSDQDKQRNLDFEDIVRRSGMYDEHPESVQRTLEQIKLLRRELAKNDVDPKLKEAMENQLAQLEDILKKMCETSDKLSKNDNARRLFNAYINNELPDAVSEEIEDKIEQALDSAFEKAKKDVEKDTKKNK